tara:strand:+ start:35225 stop:35362 length:138 start_codon:yes stop_codon:yes gene_type:complete
MQVQEPLLLTERIDQPAEPAILTGKGYAWFAFDLLVFAAVILFFS